MTDIDAIIARDRELRKTYEVEYVRTFDNSYRHEWEQHRLNTYDALIAEIERLSIRDKMHEDGKSLLLGEVEARDAEIARLRAMPCACDKCHDCLAAEQLDPSSERRADAQASLMAAMGRAEAKLLHWETLSLQDKEARLLAEADRDRWKAHAERLAEPLREIIRREASSDYISIYACPSEFARMAREALAAHDEMEER